MELLMQKREALHQGYMLEQRGGTFGMAVRTHDISIPSYREELRKRGLVQLTQDNGNSHVTTLQTTPPTPEMCREVVAVMDERRPEIIEAMQAEIKGLQLEMKDPALGRDERAYMRLQCIRMEETVKQMQWEAKNITPESLYQFFRDENIRLRASSVPAEMREALQVLRDEETLTYA